MRTFPANLMAWTVSYKLGGLSGRQVFRLTQIFYCVWKITDKSITWQGIDSLYKESSHLSQYFTMLIAFVHMFAQASFQHTEAKSSSRVNIYI